jgi:hypothetical protein
MARKKALSGLAANPRRKQSWFALVEADNSAQALGPACQKEIGIAYDDLQRVLGRLAAAIAAGKCDKAYIARRWCFRSGCHGITPTGQTHSD